MPLNLPKAANLVAADVRRRIVLKELNAGDSLPSETELMRQFEVSRPTLREAIRLLEAEGLVTIQRGARGGARVQAPDPAIAAQHVGLILQFGRTNVADVLQTQAILEEGAIRLLAERPRPELLHELEALIEAEAAALGNADRFITASAEFHVQLVERCGSPTLALMGRLLATIVLKHGLVFAAQAHSASRPRAWRLSSHHAHVEVLSLISDGDPGGAIALWAAHDKVNRRMPAPKKSVLDLLD